MRRDEVDHVKIGDVIVERGDLVRVRGMQGTWVFRSYVTNLDNLTSCVEVKKQNLTSRALSGVARCFPLDWITPVPKRKRRRRAT